MLPDVDADGERLSVDVAGVAPCCGACGVIVHKKRPGGIRALQRVVPQAKPRREPRLSIPNIAK